MAVDPEVDINDDSNDDSSSGFTDILEAFLPAASSAFSSYQAASSGIVPLGNGNYAVTPNATAAGTRIVAAPAQQNQTLLIVAALALVGFFAFKQMK